MKRNRPKYQVDDNVRLNAKELARGAQAFDDWHWGVQPNKVIDWGDNDYPPMLIECGRLVRLHVRAPDGNTARSNRHPRRKRDTMIQLSRDVSSTSHIAYDPDHPDERLYLLVDPRASRTLAKRFWADNAMRPMPLAHLASIAGGRHGKRRDYPNVMVKPVGILTSLVYYTHKKGDENPGNPRSYYIHQMGEMSKYYPILASDDKGRLWMAGGNYTCPSPGITD
jgi:hypothetical protein